MPLITGIYYYQIQLLLVKNGINYSQNWLIHLLLMNAIKYWHNDQTHEQLAAAGEIPPHLTVSQLHPPNNYPESSVESCCHVRLKNSTKPNKPTNLAAGISWCHPKVQVNVTTDLGGWGGGTAVVVQRTCVAAKPQSAWNSVTATAISGLWLASWYVAGRSACSAAARFWSGCAWIDSAFATDSIYA